MQDVVVDEKMDINDNGENNNDDEDLDPHWPLPDDKK